MARARNRPRLRLVLEKRLVVQDPEDGVTDEELCLYGLMRKVRLVDSFARRRKYARIPYLTMRVRGSGFQEIDESSQTFSAHLV